ncbi:MAG: hypothetical protein ACI9IN_002076, partial [Porticoccaceae bacterium]
AGFWSSNVVILSAVFFGTDVKIKVNNALISLQ